MASNPATDIIRSALDHVRRQPCHLALAAALLASPVAVSALGLGQPAVHSGLGAPLDVTIPVIGAGESELRAGLVNPRSSIGATNVQVRLERDAGGTPFVHLTTRAGHSEPVVALSVRVSGAAGQESIREYALLLDPQRPSAVQAPAAPRSQAAPRIQAAPRNQATRPAAGPGAGVPVLPAFERTVSAPAGGVTYGPVRPGETLYAIARALAAEHRVDPAQLANAIVAGNPRAFPGGEARRMLAGAMLAVPLEPSALAAAPSQGASRTAASSTSPAAQKRAQMSDLRDRIAATRRAIAEERTRRAELQRRLDLATRQIDALLDRQAELDQRQVELIVAVETLAAKGVAIPAQPQAEALAAVAAATAPRGGTASGAAEVAVIAAAPSAVPGSRTVVPAVPASLPTASWMLAEVKAVLGPLGLAAIALVLVLVLAGLGYWIARGWRQRDLPDRHVDDEAARERIAQVRDEFNQTLSGRQNVVALDSARVERRAAAG